MLLGRWPHIRDMVSRTCGRGRPLNAPAATRAAVVLNTSLPAAAWYCPPVVTAGTSGAAGAAATGGFIGVLLRRPIASWWAWLHHEDHASHRQCHDSAVSP